MYDMFPEEFCGRVGIGIVPYTRFYVKTRFMRIAFLPLIPLESRIFCQDSDFNELGSLTLPMQFRSVLLGWLEFPLMTVGGIGALFFGISFYDWLVGGNGMRVEGLWGAITCFLSIMFYWNLRFLFCYRSELDDAVQMAALCAYSFLKVSENSGDDTVV